MRRDHRCPVSPEGFERAYAAAAHSGVAKAAVHALKFRGQRGLARPLARRMHEALGPLPAGRWLVVPVPLHRKRRRERGYNQAELLARALAREAGQPWRPVLRRHHATRRSPGLDREERAANLAGAFTCTADLTGRDVLLVDDVLTSGATVGEAARVLRRAGARRVHVVVVSRMA